MSDQINTVTNGEESSGITRRGIYLAAIYGLQAVIGLALVVPAAMYLLVPPRTRRQTGWIDAGDVSQLTPGTPVEMTFQKSRVDGWRVVTEKKTAWVVKEPDDKIVAFGPQCTHLGCAYHWDTKLKQFACPCHASFFSVEGKVLAGPAPRPLDRYQTRIENSRLQIGELRSSNA